MASHSVANPGPEKTKYDEMRHDTMKLRRNGLYGIPKIFMPEERTCCEKCVFGTGKHADFCEAFKCV